MKKSKSTKLAEKVEARFRQTDIDLDTLLNDRFRESFCDRSFILLSYDLTTEVYLLDPTRYKMPKV